MFSKINKSGSNLAAMVTAVLASGVVQAQCPDFDGSGKIDVHDLIWVSWTIAEYDATGDGVVSMEDANLVLSAFGERGRSELDFVADAKIDHMDLIFVLQGIAETDATGDGRVDQGDLNLILSQYGQSCAFELPAPSSPSDAPTLGGSSDAPVLGSPSDTPVFGAPSDAPVTASPSDAPQTKSSQKQ